MTQLLDLNAFSALNPLSMLATFWNANSAPKAMLETAPPVEPTISLANARFIQLKTLETMQASQESLFHLISATTIATKNGTNLYWEMVDAAMENYSRMSQLGKR